MAGFRSADSFASLGLFFLIKYRLLGGFIPQAGPSLWILWWLTLGATEP